MFERAQYPFFIIFLSPTLSSSLPSDLLDDLSSSMELFTLCITVNTVGLKWWPRRRMPSYRNKCSRLRVISWLGLIPVTQLDQLYLSYKTGLFEARVPLKTCCFQVHNDGVHKTRVFLFEYYQLARNARVRRTKLETKSLRPMISIPNVTDPFIICTHVWYTRLSSCQPCILVQ